MVKPGTPYLKNKTTAEHKYPTISLLVINIQNLTNFSIPLKKTKEGGGGGMSSWNISQAIEDDPELWIFLLPHLEC